MMRLLAFLFEWWNLIAWVREVPEQFKKAWEIFAAVLLILGFSGSFVGTLTEALWPYAAPLLVFLILYVTWQAGRAWERTRWPSVKVSPLRLDVPIRVFYLWVTNGPVPAQVRVRVVRITDSSGVSHLERPWEGHWRGRGANFDGNLAAHDEAQYALLGVANLPSGNPTLFLYSREIAQQATTKERSYQSVSRDLPLEQQGVTTLKVVVDCYTEKGELVRSEQLFFSVAPTPGQRSATRSATRR